MPPYDSAQYRPHRSHHPHNRRALYRAAHTAYRVEPAAQPFTRRVYHCREEAMGTLQAASSAGDVITMRLELQAGVRVDWTCVAGDTALMNACMFGREAAVRALLEVGAAVDLQDNHGVTALMWASGRGTRVPCECSWQPGQQSI